MITATADNPPAGLAWTFVDFLSRTILLCLVVTAFTGPFHAHDVSGWARPGWIASGVLLPLIWAFPHATARGPGEPDHSRRRASDRSPE